MIAREACEVQADAVAARHGREAAAEPLSLSRSRVWRRGQTVSQCFLEEALKARRAPGRKPFLLA